MDNNEDRITEDNVTTLTPEAPQDSLETQPDPNADLTNQGTETPIEEIAQTAENAIQEQPAEENAPEENPTPDPEPTPPAPPAPPAPVEQNQMAEIDEKIAQLDAKIRLLDEREAAAKEAERKALEATKSFDSQATQHDSERHLNKAARMKAYLEKQPKVRIFVPLQGTEKKGQQLPVTMNGYRINVPKGIYVEVPEPVARQIEDSFNQTAAAEQENPYNLNNKSEAERQLLS